MRSILIYKITIFLFVLTHGDCKKSENIAGVATFVKGTPVVERNSKKIEIKLNDRIQEGDVLTTDEKSLVILTFNNELGEVEIQQNSELSIDSFLSNKKSLHLKKGNVWTKITKLSKSDEFNLHSPTCVAGVRGTKFYTFQFGEYSGTCHCEGNIQLELKGQKYNEVNKEDILVVSKNGKSIVIVPSQLKIKRPYDDRHNHSQIENSSLGKKNDMTDEDLKKMFANIEERFKELK